MQNYSDCGNCEVAGEIRPQQNCGGQQYPDNQTMYTLMELNKIYEQRIIDIDKEANGSDELKCVTYKEWVDMLRKLMQDLLETLSELEIESSNRIELLGRKLKMECKPCHGDEGKLRKDMANLLELIRRAVEDHTWNLDGLEFYTITAQDIFGNTIQDEDYCDGANNPPYKAMPSCDVQKLNSQLIAKAHEIKRLESEHHALKTDLDLKELQLCNMRAKLMELERGKGRGCTRSPQSHCQDQNDLKTTEEEIFQACMDDLKQSLCDTKKQLAAKMKENENLEKELRSFRNQTIKTDKAPHYCSCQRRTSNQQQEGTALASTAKAAEEYRNMGGNEKQFKSVTFTDLTHPSNSDNSINSVIEQEILKLTKTQDYEGRYLNLLREEVNDFINWQHSSKPTMDDCDSIKEQQRKISQIVEHLLKDLNKNHSKLQFIRTQLMAISGCCDVKACDSGYMSPEDLEPEGNLLETVRSRMDNLSAENHHLKQEISKLNADITSTASSLHLKSMNDYNERVLQEVASALSNIVGKNISHEIQNTPLENCEGEVHPICQAMLHLKEELNEKNQSLIASEQQSKQKIKELQELNDRCQILEKDCADKNHKIHDLQKAVDAHVENIKRLEDIKDNFEAELHELREMKKCDSLMERYNKLEIECQHQNTTILNLRQALEDCRKTNINSSTVSGSSNNNSNSNNNAFWGWWRNNVHDV